MIITSSMSISNSQKNIFLEKRILLLKEIEKCGSISQAAKNINISYKTAWNAIDSMNNLSSRPIVEKKAGGADGGGSVLTDYGKKLVFVFSELKKYQENLLGLLSKNIDFDLGIVKNLERISMEISARNMLLGKVVEVTTTKVSALVVLELKGGQKIVSTITKGSVDSLNLKEGNEAKAIIKSTSVMVSTSKELSLSARNVIPGKILEIISENVDSEIAIDIGNGQKITSVITTNSVKNLGLKVNSNVFAVIKSTSVMIGK